MTIRNGVTVTQYAHFLIVDAEAASHTMLDGWLISLPNVEATLQEGVWRMTRFGKHLLHNLGHDFVELVMIRSCITKSLADEENIVHRLRMIDVRNLNVFQFVPLLSIINYLDRYRMSHI